MRKFVFIAVIISCTLAISCSVKKGCPSNGRNIGAERILSGDPKATKDMKKAKKFKGGKF